MQSTNLQSFNNLTGDVMLTPQSYGLFMRDIDEEASLSLKNVIYNGNINLTYDLFQELQELQETKYDFIEPTGAINGNRMGDVSMTGKESGLYMNHLRLGYWDGTQWKSYIANNGEFFFKGNDNNYIHWNGSTLKIEGDITARNGHFTGNITSDATITSYGKIISGDINSNHVIIDDYKISFNGGGGILNGTSLSHSEYNGIEYINVEQGGFMFNGAFGINMYEPITLIEGNINFNYEGFHIDTKLFIEGDKEVLASIEVDDNPISTTHNIKVEINGQIYFIPCLPNFG